MDAIALFLTFAILCFCSSTSEMETFYSANGWRPIPNDRVVTDYWNSKVSSAGWAQSLNRGHDFIKIVNAPKINEELMVSNIIEPTTNVIVHNQGAISNTSNVPSIKRKVITNDNMEFENLNDDQLRRGKKIDFQTNADFNKITENHNNIIIKEITQEVNKNNTYKVIEDIDDGDELLSAGQNVYFSKNNYKAYEDIKKPNNFTDNLMKILLNYNIRTNDRLPNYALSLRQNSRNSNGGYMYMRVPIRIPLKSNSANHASVDPLLAVFLSNYGHYLPGLYGFQQNYKNLYGYLASNNIHNNKPFGSYKIFSDTDSSL